MQDIAKFLSDQNYRFELYFGEHRTHSTPQPSRENNMLQHTRENIQEPAGLRAPGIDKVNVLADGEIRVWKEPVPSMSACGPAAILVSMAF
jgi:hypothetical protein